MLRLYGLALNLLFAAAVSTAMSELVAEPSFTPEQIEFFETQVRPVLIAHCYDCHSSDAKELKAKLHVDSREALLRGGESGPAIVPGKPAESDLIAAVRYESIEMPPDGKLAAKDIVALTKWVEMGAPWPQVTSSPGRTDPKKEIDWEKARAGHWAWRAITRPAVPDDATTQKLIGPATQTQLGATPTPIDRFIISARERVGLRGNDTAVPRTLVRRIYVDLVGVVPSPEQTEQFVAAAARDHQLAVFTLVDRLLQSPLYGQRWGRHWLDVARYSDGRGGFLDNESLDQAWRYRDWVVNALNEDMPIDRFLQLQIAGDIIGDFEDAVATGFFAVGPTYRSDGGDPDSVAQAKGETLDDRVDTLTRGLLGITGSCARCHDHKFDPIPQLDYYSLAGVFNNSSVHRVPLAHAQIVEQFNQHKHKVDGLQKKIKDVNRKLKKEKREATAEEKGKIEQARLQLEELKKDPPVSFDTAHALHDTSDKDMNVAIRGNLRKTGELAPRRFLRILSGAKPTKFTEGSGRRQLAAAITSPCNPLTARVFVNRVWMHHFGAGLVRTPSNFGSLGELPTHPELLDWLAADFMDHGWSLKRLHRQIVTSSTYQQSSEFNEACHHRDGDNRMLWRMSPRRMDVEVWRDSLLAVTGKLETALGGPPLDNIVENRRRTIYAKVSRNGDVFTSDEFLRRFDFPLMRATVAKRPSSIVPQQYLFLLNSRFMVEQAKQLVARLNVEAETDEERIKRAYVLLYGRAVDNVELRMGLDFLTRDHDTSSELPEWAQYAQTLLSSNEFMYVR